MRLEYNFGMDRQVYHDRSRFGDGKTGRIRAMGKRGDEAGEKEGRRGERGEGMMMMMMLSGQMEGEQDGIDVKHVNRIRGAPETGVWNWVKLRLGSRSAPPLPLPSIVNTYLTPVWIALFATGDR